MTWITPWDDGPNVDHQVKELQEHQLGASRSENSSSREVVSGSGRSAQKSEKLAYF